MHSVIFFYWMLVILRKRGSVGYGVLENFGQFSSPLDTKGLKFPASRCGSLSALLPLPLGSTITASYLMQGPDCRRLFPGPPALLSDLTLLPSGEGEGCLSQSFFTPLMRLCVGRGGDLWDLTCLAAFTGWISGNTMAWIFAYNICIYRIIFKCLRYWETTLIWQEHLPYGKNRKGERSCV